MFISNLGLEEKKNFLELAHFVSNCDNDLHVEEIKILMEIRDEISLSEFEYQVQGKNVDRIINHLSKSDLKSRKGMFLEIMNIIMSDRKYDENEMKIAEKIATAWGIIPDESIIVLKWIKDIYKKQ